MKTAFCPKCRRMMAFQQAMVENSEIESCLFCGENVTLHDGSELLTEEDIYAVAYQDGYDVGVARGYEAGHSDGYAAGHENGYAAGKEVGKKHLTWWKD